MKIFLFLEVSMMKTSVKKTLLIIAAAASLLLAGCGKLGESEATEFVKKNCKIPDSFEKVSYVVDEKAGLSHLDFKAKNMLGVEVPGRVYFLVSKDGAKPIDTSGIDQNILDEFEKTDPAHFAGAVQSYKTIQKIIGDNKFKMDMFLDEYNNLDTMQNYYSWRSVKNSAPKINRILKAYHDAYDQAPDVVKKHFDKPVHYFVIHLEGNVLQFQGKADRPEEYPEPSPNEAVSTQ